MPTQAFSIHGNLKSHEPLSEEYIARVLLEVEVHFNTKYPDLRMHILSYKLQGRKKNGLPK
jgi:hypothetical protein